MQLKRPSQYGQWVFFIGGKDESDNPDEEVEVIRVPRDGFYNRKFKLEAAVAQELKNLHAQGATGYLESVIDEATSYGKTMKEFLSILIEHQICVRAGKASGLCWDSTFGDKIHSVTEKVDDLIAKAPEPVKKVWRKVVKFATPKATVPNRVSSCRSCGGGRSLKVSKNNRGRAGRI